VTCLPTACVATEILVISHFVSGKPTVPASRAWSVGIRTGRIHAAIGSRHSSRSLPPATSVARALLRALLRRRGPVGAGSSALPTSASLRADGGPPFPAS
jgi:hypothetical protein